MFENNFFLYIKIFIILFILSILFFLIQKEKIFNIQNVQVNGKKLSLKEKNELMKLSSSQNIFFFDSNALKDKILKNYPETRSIIIKKFFPNEIHIFLKKEKEFIKIFFDNRKKNQSYFFILEDEKIKKTSQEIFKKKEIPEIRIYKFESIDEIKFIITSLKKLNKWNSLFLKKINQVHYYGETGFEKNFLTLKDTPSIFFYGQSLSFKKWLYIFYIKRLDLFKNQSIKINLSFDSFLIIK